MTAIVDSRRLTGPHLLGDRPGAVLDVTLAGDGDAMIAGWRQQARRLLDAVGWSGEEIATRRFAGGASLVLTAPIDGLYAATEVNEAAWEAAAASRSGAAIDSVAVAARLREAIVREHDIRLRALRDAARVRGLTFLIDDETVSAGSGCGAAVWHRADLPDPASVEWRELSDVPIVLVTGSNGKTTSVRLLAAIAEAAGLTPAHTSTDGVFVGSEQLAHGDFAGPMGARLALRDRRAQFVVLETARGGILRRGLAVDHADAAVVTNVAADHLDDFGVDDVPTLAALKLVVARVVRPGGRIALNADDPGLVTHALGIAPATWFALERETPLVAAELAAGGDASYIEDGAVMLARGGRAAMVEHLSAVPLTLGGAARYNVSNVLGAVAAAAAAAEAPGGRAITVDAIASALRTFGARTHNPGRANLFDVGGVRVLVDYGHNPHGLSAIRSAVEALAEGRRLLVIGQAGDRGDDAIRELARAGWELRPDRVVLKELATLHRGRPAGEVRRILADEFRRMGLAPEELVSVESERDALDTALDWARPGDFVIMLAHEDRSGVLSRLDALSRR